MAATGFTPISLYYSTTASAAPTAGNLVNGELAINITDGRLYYKDNAGVVKVIAGSGGAGVVAGSNTQVQYNNNGVFGASANMTFNGTTLTVADLTDSSLTANRVVYAGTGGNLINSANLTFDGTTLTPSALTVTGATALNGGTTIGDASGDALTINSSAVSIPNGLNFDSNTLVIDAANNVVGIGIGSPSQKLDVQAASGGTTARFRNINTGNFIDFFETNTNTRLGLIGSIDGTNWLVHNDKAGYMAFDTSNLERMRITSAGNVGIGTSSINARLQVTASNVSTTPIAILENTSTTSGDAARLNFLTADDGTAGRTRAAIESVTDGTNGGRLTFYTRTSGSLTEKMRLDSSGNLGLGVTPSAWSGQKSITFGVGRGFVSSSDSAFRFYAGYNAYNDGSWKYSASTTAALYEQGDSAHRWYSAASGTAGNAINFTQAMTLDASGNLGIGTTSPSRRLDVFTATSIPMRIGTGDSNMAIEFVSTLGTRFNWLVGAQYNVSNSFEITPSTAAGNTTFSTPAFVISSGGRVGIGTNSPAVRLDVSATDAIRLPVGTTAQRPTGATGYIRFNSDTSGFEGFNGSAWAAVGGGNSTNTGLWENAATISSNYTIATGNNAMSAGPITVASGVTVTVPSGSVWTIV